MEELKSESVRETEEPNSTEGIRFIDEDTDAEEVLKLLEKNEIKVLETEKELNESGRKSFEEMGQDPLCQDKREVEVKEGNPGWKRYQGVVYTMLSTNSFSLSSTILKKYSHIHPFTLGTWAFPLAALVSVPFIFYTICVKKKSPVESFWPVWKHKRITFFIWFRAVASSGISYSLIMSFKYISVGDTRTIMAATVITVYFFGWMCLGEKCGIVPIFVSILALTGIAVITRPPMLTGAEGFDRETVIGVSIAIGALMLTTVVIVTLRYLHNVHQGMLNFILYAWAFGQSFFLALVFNKLETPETEMDALAICSVGLFKAFGNLFLVLALQTEEAGVVALVRTSEVIFTFFWQWVLIGKKPDGISILGASLVLTGVFVVTLRKWVATLSPQHKHRQRLAFLLR